MMLESYRLPRKLAVEELAIGESISALIYAALP